MGLLSASLGALFVNYSTQLIHIGNSRGTAYLLTVHLITYIRNGSEPHARIDIQPSLVPRPGRFPWVLFFIYISSVGRNTKNGV